MIFADAHIYARVVLCATLTHDDVASLGKLSAEDLETEAFAF